MAFRSPHLKQALDHEAVLSAPPSSLKDIALYAATHQAFSDRAWLWPRSQWWSYTGPATLSHLELQISRGLLLAGGEQSLNWTAGYRMNKLACITLQSMGFSTLKKKKNSQLSQLVLALHQKAGPRGMSLGWEGRCRQISGLTGQPSQPNQWAPSQGESLPQKTTQAGEEPQQLRGCSSSRPWFSSQPYVVAHTDL